MSPRKLIFLAIVAAIVIGIGITFSMLSSGPKDKGPKGPKEMNVWVVSDDVAGFEGIVTGFKDKFPKYKNTTVVIKKFASYADYEKSLLNVIADGNSPEVFTLSSDGSALLDSKTEPLPDDLMGPGLFESSFNSVFDDLLAERQAKNEEGKDITIKELKGIPLGYETMGSFYNSDIVTNAVPKSWADLGKQASASSEESTVSSVDTSDSDTTDEDGESLPKPKTTSNTDKKYLAGVGLSGRYVTNASDLIALFFLQNGFDTYSRLSENGAVKWLTDYFTFWVTEEAPMSGVKPNGNGLFAARTDLDGLKITMADLFARGKVGVVFGYPSYLREIQYSIKRSSQENVLTAKNFRSTSIPYANPDKPANLARYQYFALSKTAPDQQAGLDFLTYLMTKDAQSSYLKSFPYYLPALNELADERKSQSIDRAFPRIKYESFMPLQWVKVSPFDKGFSSEFNSYFRTASDTKADPTAIMTGLNDLLGCQKRHLIDKANFDDPCPTH